MIEHHLPEDWIVAHAAGIATPAEDLLVMGHLSLCPHCRTALAVAETVGGAVLAQSEEVEIGRDLLARTLDRLDESRIDLPEARDPDGVLPEALVRVAGRSADLKWRWAFPGVDQIVLDVAHHAGSPPARLFRIAAGGFIPPHEHRGVEASLVFTGGFTDEIGRYGRGDVCVREEGSRHGQDIDDGEDCVVLVVADRPFRGRSLLGLLAQVLRGF